MASKLNIILECFYCPMEPLQTAGSAKAVMAPSFSGLRSVVAVAAVVVVAAAAAAAGGFAAAAAAAAAEPDVVESDEVAIVADAESGSAVAEVGELPGEIALPDCDGNIAGLPQKAKQSSSIGRRSATPDW